MPLLLFQKDTRISLPVVFCKALTLYFDDTLEAAAEKLPPANCSLWVWDHIPQINTVICNEVWSQEYSLKELN